MPASSSGFWEALEGTRSSRPWWDDTRGRVPYFRTDNESADSYARLMALHTAGWCVLWVVCGLTAKLCVCPFLPPSSKGKENSPFYVGQKLTMEIKVLILCYLANTVVYDMYSMDPADQFRGYPMAEVSGVIFTTSEIADLLLSGAMGFLDGTMVAHHCIHIFLGLLIRGHGHPAYTAAILMAQETSGIFLNYYLLMRNRAGKHWSVLVSQGLFALTFFVWRLGLGTYGTVHFLMHAAEHISPAYARWQVLTLGAALVIASCLQWYWGKLIVKGLMRLNRKKDD